MVCIAWTVWVAYTLVCLAAAGLTVNRTAICEYEPGISIYGEPSLDLAPPGKVCTYDRAEVAAYDPGVLETGTGRTLTVGPGAANWLFAVGVVVPPVALVAFRRNRRIV